jgi:hypothetical protein
MNIDPTSPPKTLRSWAKITGIPYTILRAAAHKGSLQHYRWVDGGNMYVTAEDMQAFIDASRSE